MQSSLVTVGLLEPDLPQNNGSAKTKYQDVGISVSSSMTNNREPRRLVNTFCGTVHSVRMEAPAQHEATVITDTAE